ncbi:MAG: hypothetical protein JWO19_40 [Bryobacterales bacterium]|nr:hypothetical protein [Bryobacterales bacterium]
MKEAVVLILVSVLIVGGIGIWLASGVALPFFSSQPAVHPASDEQPTAEETEPVKPLKAPTKVAKKPVVEASLEPAVVRPVAEVLVVPPAPPPAPKQFPSPTEISVGLARDNIAERFGQPALATTTTSDDGRVRETLVYSRKSGRDVTVIRIEDGKVLSAYSR